MTGLPGSVVERAPVPGGDIGQAERVRLDDGRDLFVKTYGDADGPDMAAAEADGLRWLGEVDGGPAVPEVVAVDGSTLALSWIDAGRRSPESDERLGRELAALHVAGAEAYGGGDTFLGTLRMPGGTEPTWPQFWVEHRLLPLVERAEAARAVDPDGVRSLRSLTDVADDLFGPTEPPARLHGDLWWGNVMPGSDQRVWLVDPAAHGGHREADLAMLDLFGGLPAGLVDAYDEAYPLTDGWRERIPLHQLTPLLVHAVLFGGGYGQRAMQVARRYA